MIEFTAEAYVIAAVSILLAFANAVVRQNVMDLDRAKEIRLKLKEYQAEIKTLSKSGDTKKAAKAQQEMMELSMENMRMAYKPMLITLIPLLLVFGWLGGTYGDLQPTYNITIESSLPADIAVLDAKVGGGGNYSAENKTLVWSSPKARSDTEVEVAAEFAVNSGNVSLLEYSVVTLSYFDENGTEGNVSSDMIQPVEGALMSVKKEVAAGGQLGTASYKVTYKNLRSNNVVYFPVYADICIGIGVFHIHNGLDWLGWYLVCAFSTSMVINKVSEKYPLKLRKKKA